MSANALGKLEEEFANMSEGRKLATFILIFICFGLAFFLFTLVPTIKDWFNYILFIVSGCFAVLGGIGCIQSFWRNRDVKIQRYENGVVVNQNGVVNTAQWDEIKSIREEESEAEVQMGFHKVKSGARYYYTIEKKNGTSFRFFMTDQPLNSFGLFLRIKTIQTLYPQMEKDFDAGKTLEFGAFKVNNIALTKNDMSVCWSDVRDVIVKNGIIQVINKENKSVFGLMLSGDVPNAHLLAAIAGKVLKR